MPSFLISVFPPLIPEPLPQWGMKGKEFSIKNWGATLVMTNSWSCQTQDTAGWHQHCCCSCYWGQHVGKGFGCARQPLSAPRWACEKRGIFCKLHRIFSIFKVPVFPCLKAEWKQFSDSQQLTLEGRGWTTWPHQWFLPNSTVLWFCD